MELQYLLESVRLAGQVLAGFEVLAIQVLVIISYFR